MTQTTSTTQPAPRILLRDGYAPGTPGSPGSPAPFDEMLEAHGLPRAHWRTFLQSLQTLSPEALDRRWEQARRMIRENGVTYNVYGDPRGADRPWALDPIPMFFSAHEWTHVEEGLRQRARLLDQILADVYGPQRLLAEGLLPADLIFAHPGFLRPCHGMNVPGNRRLHFYAADMGRFPDGQIGIVGDRTRAPSGAGYALENRLIVQRILPEAFRDCGVQRMARFFSSMRDALADLAPHNHDNPRVVVLTSGPLNETYFEHSYLARYLGYTLAEGADLAVRDQNVYLKTLGGLQQVDVILRRVDDDYCDPLELRGNSFLGTAGLIQAARAGNVAIANALGAGLLETAAIMPFLPTLCRRLLGEELRLPSVTTWWCGDPASLSHVLANLEHMVIKPAYPDPTPGAGVEPVMGELSAQVRAELAQRMRAQPGQFVAQERLELSTVPVLTGQRLEPRRALVRAFVLAADDGFMVMPGGLTRVASAADSHVVSLQRGAGSKDTWVLSDGPVDSFTLLEAKAHTVELQRGGGGLPSRAADNLFWLGRYLERTEGSVRLLRGVVARLLEQNAAGAATELPRIFYALTQLGRPAPAPLPPAPTSPSLFTSPSGGGDEGASGSGAGGDGPGESLEPQLWPLVFDTQRDDSLSSLLRSIHRTAALVRDRLSADAWRILFALQENLSSVQRPASSAQEGQPPSSSDAGHWTLDTGHDILDLANQIILTLAAFGGLSSESMTRGQGWRFLDMGRRLERAQQTASLLRDTLGTPAEPEGPVLEAVLEVADSIMTYRRQYFAGMRDSAVLDLVLNDETNPRSLVFQLIVLSEHVNHLPVLDSVHGLSPEQRIILRLLNDVRLAQPEQLCIVSPEGRRTALIELMKQVAADLPALSDTLANRYLSHTTLAQQMSSTGEDKKRRLMHYQVTHITEYQYSDVVSICHSEAHLSPRDNLAGVCTQSHIIVEPIPSVWAPRRDYFGNLVHHFAIQSPHKTLRVTAISQVLLGNTPPDPKSEIPARLSSPKSDPKSSTPLSLESPGIPLLQNRQSAIDNRQSPPWDQVRDTLRADHSAQSLDAIQFLFESPLVTTNPEVRAYAAASFPPGRPLLEATLDLTARIHRDFRYDPKATNISTPLDQVLNLRCGVCQDFAHLQIACLRSLGLPARYVSGYLATKADGSARPVGADASHAWLSFFCPDLGWTDIDPTNNQLCHDRHITVAWGRDYADVAPVKGVIHGGGQHTISVQVNVIPAPGRGG